MIVSTGAKIANVPSSLPSQRRAEFRSAFLPIANVSTGSFGQIVRTVSGPTSPFGSVLGADASPRLIQLKAQFTF